MAAYSINDMVDMITKQRAIDPAAAYGMYNGFSNMGGNGMYDAGALTTALRSAWGEDAGKAFVADGTRDYGNTLFDPTTGQWGGMGKAQGMGGMIAGYDPTRFDRSTAGLQTISYDPTKSASNLPGPTGTGVNAAYGITTNPDGTYSQKPGYLPQSSMNAQTGAGPAPAAAPAGRAVNPGTITPTQQPGSGHPGVNPGTITPTQGGARTPDVFPGAGASAPAGGAPGAGAPGAGTPGAGTPGAGAPGAAGAPGLGDQFNMGTGALTPYVAPTRAADSSQPFDMFNDAGYQFRLKEALDAAKNQAGARGQLDSGALLKALEDRASGLASDEYGAAYGRYDANRKFDEGKFQSDRTFGRTGYENDRDFGENQDRYRTGFNYGVAKDDRDFTEGVRRNDLQFNREGAQSDRAFDWGTLKDLAGLGMQGTNGNAAVQTALAQLLSQNTLAGGNAAGAGTIGGANAINQTVSQFLSQLFGNKLVNAAGG